MVKIAAPALLMVLAACAAGPSFQPEPSLSASFGTRAQPVVFRTPAPGTSPSDESSIPMPRSPRAGFDYFESPGSITEILIPPACNVGERSTYQVREGSAVRVEQRHVMGLTSDGGCVFSTDNAIQPVLSFDRFGNGTVMPEGYGTPTAGRTMVGERVRATPAYVTLTYPLRVNVLPPDATFTFSSLFWPESSVRSVFQEVTAVRLCQSSSPCIETIRVTVHAWVFGAYAVHQRWVSPQYGVVRLRDSGSVLIFPRRYIDEEAVRISISQSAS